MQEDGATQQDAGPATLYADIRYLQQDPSLTGLAPAGGRVRIEGAVVTAAKSSANSTFFIQNATGPKEVDWNKDTVFLMELAAGVCAWSVNGVDIGKVKTGPAIRCFRDSKPEFLQFAGQPLPYGETVVNDKNPDVVIRAPGPAAIVCNVK